MDKPYYRHPLKSVLIAVLNFPAPEGSAWYTLRQTPPHKKFIKEFTQNFKSMFSLTHKISTIKLIKSQYLSLKILTFCIITKMFLFGEAWYGTLQKGRTHISTSFYRSKKVCFLDEFLKLFEGAVAVLTVCTSDLRH